MKDFVFLRNQFLVDLLASIFFSAWAFYRFREQADSGLGDNINIYLRFAVAGTIIAVIAVGISQLLQHLYRLVPAFLYLLIIAPLFLGFGYRGLVHWEWANGKPFGGTFLGNGEILSALALALIFAVPLAASVIITRILMYLRVLLVSSIASSRVRIP
jgi:hypothetical protein